MASEALADDVIVSHRTELEEHMKHIVGPLIQLPRWFALLAINVIM